MSAQREPGGEARDPMVVFIVDGERYALPLGVIQEVRGADEASEEVPSVAAHRLLGLGERPRSGGRALEFVGEDTHFLLEVDSVEGVMTIRTDAIEPPPAYFDSGTRSLVAGILPGEGEMLIVLRAEILVQRSVEALSG